MVADLPVDDDLFRDELFVPFVAVAPVDSIDEALSLANDTELGLTAGFFSADDAEVDEFLNRIEAGVVYVNRAAGSHHRCMARGATLRWLEGFWNIGQGRRRSVLRPAIHA